MKTGAPSESTMRTLHSVGIDVGTTTTQVIFSRLEMHNTAGAAELPRYEFTRREVVYQSPVVFTPIDFGGGIRAAELLAFIEGQYREAGLRPDQVESGAIIITGETSKAANARQTVLDLAERLGDFVVATAGPHLESVIAGHGSGAAESSRAGSSTVLNIDIGGGTSNFAVFRSGRLVDTACLNVGGHLLEFDASGAPRHVHEPARRVLAELRGRAGARREGPPTAQEIPALLERLAELVVEVIECRPSELCRSLLMTAPLREALPLDALTISGGVGECFYRDCGPDLAFGDIGPGLAAALRRHPSIARLPVREPRQTVRATVIGAGTHTIALSGSTIWLHSDSLPLRNLPVLHCADPDPADAATLARCWSESARLQDLAPAHSRHAIAIPPRLPVSYRAVLMCSDALQRFVRDEKVENGPIVVIASQDIGKGLGMELAPALRGRELAVIDEVQVREWDYIDIGRGLFGGSVVPLTVKSLAFPGSTH